ncbi:MAG: SDR family oxidoreductase [Alphaproteobacteria bacterium]|nr:SDR family oxidoreductase [Alphaproteobacteria bacterium]
MTRSAVRPAADGRDSGRAALVTGAGTRLGEAMARALGAAGFNVAVHYRSSEAAAARVASEIATSLVTAKPVQADLSDEASTAGLIAKAVGAVGPLSLLVNSASAFEADEIETMTKDSWDLHLNTNLRAPVKLTQDFAAQAVAGRDNLVVNMIDQRVLKLTPQFLSYTASKAALLAVTKTLAQALGPSGIRVNAIGPGPTMRNKRQSEDDWRRQNEATILGHGAKPADIVDALMFFVGAPSVTGQMIAVDGGQHLVWRTPDVLVNE